MLGDHLGIWQFNFMGVSAHSANLTLIENEIEIQFYTHVGGFTMLSNSACVFGTRRIIILRPSVEPIPIDANERIEIASGYIFPDPLQSLKMYELFRCNNVCSGCGDVADDVNVPGDVFRLLFSSAISDN